MKKVLLSLAAVALSTAAFAQTAGVPSLSVRPFEAAAAQKNVKKAPAKANLAENQRLLGYNTGDTFDATLGFGQAIDIRLGSLLLPEMLEKFDGAKIVGIRYALADPLPVSKVAIVEEGATTEAVSKTQTGNCVAGWNTVMFDEPYTIDDNTPFYICYDVSLSSAYSIYIYNSNNPHEGGFMGYADFGEGAQWAALTDSYGNYLGDLAIQAIVESDNFSSRSLTPQDFGPFFVGLNTTRNLMLNVTNDGAGVSNFSYVVSVDGTPSEEQFCELEQPVGVAEGFTAAIPVQAESETGSAVLEVKITKVNGESNDAADKTATGTLNTISRLFKQNVVMEEFTGTGCGYCPRGIAGMEMLAEKYPDTFIGIGIHQYNSSDPMYNSNYKTLDWPGAPNCVLNRNGQYIDPFYGNRTSIEDDFKAAMDNLPMVEVSVSGVWNEDSTKVTATANVESIISGKYNIDFVLVADSVQGSSNSWRQSNYFASYSAASVNNDPYLSKFCKGGEYGYSSFAYAFNDVLIGSSYSGSRNNATLDELVEDQTTTATYELAMPVKTALKKAIDKTKVSVIAIVYDPATGAILNAGKNRNITAATGIQGVNGESNASAAEVARYNAAGQRINAPQKGLNIVRLANGKTYKEMVK